MIGNSNPKKPLSEGLGLMEPMRPSGEHPELSDLALALVSESSRLAGMLHPKVQASVGDLVRSMNCYYSNLIEGHDTHPKDIDRALAKDYSTEGPKRALQKEAVAHIEVQRLIDQMVDARLLVVQTLEGGKGSTVEIVHESLVRNWPMLRHWLDENQDDAELVDQLRTASRQWAKQRDDGLLWRGEMADEAKKFVKRYKGPLSDVERGFLDAVVHLEVAAQRRRRVALIAAFTGMAGLIVAAMVALVIIQKSRSEATSQRAVAVEAQKEAERQLAVAQKKEQERQAAEAAKTQAEAATTKAVTEKAVVDVKLDQSIEQLEQTNKELKSALAQATENEKIAKASAERARVAHEEAVVAQGEALKAKAEAEKLYHQEYERAERMKKQLGSSIVDELK